MWLNAKRISVEVAGKLLLEDVTISAKAGAVTAIVGPSGAGKSTLMSVLSGDIQYSGQVELNNLDIQETSASELSQHRAVLAQSAPLAFPFTVWEIVRLGIAPNEPAEIASQALSQVGMSGFERSDFQSLSGGEQQRVQLARVLCQVWQPVENDVPRWLFWMNRCRASIPGNSFAFCILPDALRIKEEALL